MTTTTHAFVASTRTARATAAGLAAVVTLSLLLSVGGTANQQYEDVLQAASATVPDQVVVITGTRLVGV
jgi:hypothetical protein